MTIAFDNGLLDDVGEAIKKAGFNGSFMHVRYPVQVR